MDLTDRPPASLNAPAPGVAIRHPMVAPLLLGGILALAAVLDLFRLGARSLWQDEATSVALAHLGRTALVKVLWGGEANMALYYGLLHIWVGIVGAGEFAVRTLSAALAVAAVAAQYALGTRMFGVRVGLIGALLLSLNAFEIAYGQEARSYSLLLLLVTVSSFAFLRVVERPGRANMAVYCATSVLAVYAHFFAALVLGAQWLSLAFLGRRSGSSRAVLACGAVICLLVVPLAVVAARHPHQADWIPRPGPRAIVDLFEALTGSSATGAKPLLLAYFIACAAAFVVGIKQFAAAPSSFATWRYGFLATWLVAPLVLALAISVVRPIFVPYYFIILLPPLVLLASAGISGIRVNTGIAGVVFIIAAMAIYEDVHYLRGASVEDWRGATAYAASRLHPGDGFVFDPTYVETPFAYYRTQVFRAGEPPPTAFPWHWSWPRIADGQPKVARAPDEVLRSLPSRYPRIWLFSREGETAPHLLALLRAGCARATERPFGTVRVTLYTGCRP